MDAKRAELSSSGDLHLRPVADHERRRLERLVRAARRHRRGAKGAVDNSNQSCKLISADLIGAPSQITASSASAHFDELEARLQVADISLMYVAEAATFVGCGGAVGIAIRPEPPASCSRRRRPGS